MIHLFDKAFTVSYTLDDFVIVSKNGKEIAKRKHKDLQDKAELKAVAISMLDAKYNRARYYSTTEIVNEFGVSKMRISYILKELVPGYHFIRGGLNNSSVLFTEAGHQVIAKFYERKKASE